MKNGATTFGKTTVIITTISVNGLECDFSFLLLLLSAAFFIVLLNVVILKAVYAEFSQRQQKQASLF